jgi:hypothetical protein
MDELLEKARENYPIGTRFKVAHIDHLPSIYTVAGNWRFEGHSKNTNIVCDILEVDRCYVPCLKFNETWAPIIELGETISNPLIFN